MTEATIDKKAIATAILKQLGGNKFIAMTGAKNLIANGSTLQFKLPARFAKSGINYVTVRLNSMDLYDMIFATITRRKGVPTMTVKAECNGLYFDMIRDAFTDETGLNTSL